MKIFGKLIGASKTKKDELPRDGEVKTSNEVSDSKDKSCISYKGNDINSVCDVEKRPDISFKKPNKVEIKDISFEKKGEHKLSSKDKAEITFSHPKKDTNIAELTFKEDYASLGTGFDLETDTYYDFETSTYGEKARSEIRSYYESSTFFKKLPVNLYYIAINIKVLNSDEDVKSIITNILELSEESIVKIFVFSDNFKESDYFYLKNTNVEHEMKRFIESFLSKGSSFKFDLGIVGTLSCISSHITKLEKNKMLLQKEKVNKYEIQNIFVIFYGNSSFDEFDYKLLEEIKSINKVADTTYYMTQDETIAISNLGFRNIYLLNRSKLEEVN